MRQYWCIKPDGVLLRLNWEPPCKHLVVLIEPTESFYKLDVRIPNALGDVHHADLPKDPLDFARIKREWAAFMAGWGKAYVLG